MKILIKNGYIVSMVSEIIKGDILIEDDRIKRIGHIDCEVDRVIDATNKIVMPGLINAHTHVGMSLFRGCADEKELMTWLQKDIWPVEDKMTASDVYSASMLSGIEMIKSGTTTFNDQYFFEDETAKMAEKLGLRAILSRCIIGDGEEAHKRVAEAEELYNNWHNKADGRIKICVGLHAPYTCPPDTIRRGVELADRLGSPIHIHYLETKDEVKQMADKYQMTATEYLKKANVFNYHVMLAHGVHIDNESIETLKEISGGIVHNPVSNQKLGSGIADIRKLRSNGINVALGTDGQGSTNTLDMFEEIKSAAYLQKVIYQSATALSGEDVMKMATIEGAKVLGIDSEVGSLEENKKADIVIIDINKPHLCPMHDIYSLLAYSVNGADVETSIINGQIVMENRQIINADEQEIMRDCRRITESLFRR
ncbi:MAG: amidohydrolase [Clostridia bacterium]|nr:amidohydrolase [Clostridia bacterium]